MLFCLVFGCGFFFGGDFVGLFFVFCLFVCLFGVFFFVFCFFFGGGVWNSVTGRHKGVGGCLILTKIALRNI